MFFNVTLVTIAFQQAITWLREEVQITVILPFPSWSIFMARRLFLLKLVIWVDSTHTEAVRHTATL
jgi:hypothetical protein